MFSTPSAAFSHHKGSMVTRVIGNKYIKCHVHKATTRIQGHQCGGQARPLRSTRDVCMNTKGCDSRTSVDAYRGITVLNIDAKVYVMLLLCNLCRTWRSGYSMASAAAGAPHPRLTPQALPSQPPRSLQLQPTNQPIKLPTATATQTPLRSSASNTLP